MGWGLYALDSAKAGDELLPFVGALYSKAEFTTFSDLDHRVSQYAMKVKSNEFVRASTRDRSMRMANLEYIGWVDEILGVNYGAFELILLYYTWVQATTTGARATMKQDEYGFTLLKVDRVIPYSVDSFAFPLHVQQVFF